MTLVLLRSPAKSTAPRVTRLDAWLAATLVTSRRAPAGVIVGIAVFVIVGVVVAVLMKYPENLFMDSTEAYAWGMQFLGGYGRHPPLTGWIARLWYAVFPAANWSSYALSGLMTGVSLVSIYLIGRRVLGQRRAALIVFAMMLYPLFIGAKADRFNNYQVLLALLPLTVWLFLRAFDKRTVGSGAALGLAAAAATLTIYSAAFGLAAIALAALVHPRRAQFLTSPAPYVALLVYLLALAPHVIWLVQHDFSTLRWASGFVGGTSFRGKILPYLGHHFALLAFCLIGPAIALWPWRKTAVRSDAPVHDDASFADERLLVLVIAAALVFGPVVVGLVFDALLKPDWGDPFFFLVPVAVALLLPQVLVTRRAVARAAVVAAVFATILLVGSPVFSWVRFRLQPNDGPYRPLIEAAADITAQWRERFHSPLPIVVSSFEVAAPIVFYSADHPKMFADFDPGYSPWIDYPAELKRKGYVGVCFADDAGCRSYLKTLNANAEARDITLQRHRYGAASAPMQLHLEFTGPGG